MTVETLSCDEDLIRRLPLPLAQLYRRALNAKTAMERHRIALDLWEAGLKLLASTAVVFFARQATGDARVEQELRSLARPSLGHWWSIARLLVPILADKGDPGFVAVRNFLLGDARDDLPGLAGLDAAIRQQLGGQSTGRALVKPSELFDRLVTYRNKVFGHGAWAGLAEMVHERMAGALICGLAELYGRLDVLAGRRLIYVSDVQQSGGLWVIERILLAGSGPRRHARLELPRSAANRLPDGNRVYLDEGEVTDGASPAESATSLLERMTSLYPLACYELKTKYAEQFQSDEANSEKFFFLNSRPNERKTEYLCYTSGEQVPLADRGVEQRELLARVLGMPVSEDDAAAWAAQSQAKDPPAEPAPSGPRMIADFLLVSELGEGGMGIVYRAVQPSLRRHVALKCLKRVDDQRKARFQREIRALGRVEHPNLVKVHTSGSDGQDYFYAMELVEGATLSAVADRLRSKTTSAATLNLQTWQETFSTVCDQTRKSERPMSNSPGISQPRAPAEVKFVPPIPEATYVRHVVDLVRQAAEATHALHDAGIIHRDIKPGNIIVSPDGARAVLTDLGLAHIADEIDRKLTHTRQFIGTLRYASPEQVFETKVDRRTDVYSLGATLWELLTLQPLFNANGDVTDEELRRRIRVDEPQPMRQFHPGISSDLEAIVAKCLEKDPRRRYESSQGLANDLSRWLMREPVTARPRTLVGTLGREIRRRHKAAAISIWAILTVLLSVALIYTWRASRLQALQSDRKGQQSVAAERGAESPENGIAAAYSRGRTVDGAKSAKTETPLTASVANPTPADAQLSSSPIVMPRAVAAPSYAFGKQWALLIGAERYKNAPQLQFTVNDVHQLSQTLVQYGGYPYSQILQLTDDGDTPANQPLKASLEESLPEFLKKPTKEDSILVYFSGHSFISKDGKLYLAPLDCDPTNPVATGVGAEWLRGQLAAR